MTQKFNSEEQLAPRDLAQHLRKPDGETGKKIGVMMNKGNNHICLNTYKLLDPQEGDHVLEIGMGNGFFVKDLLTMSKGLTLTGVDFSPTMVEEANVLNEAMVAKNVARFICASVEELPFPDSQFNMATSTNTIYFWPDPENNARELLRVLKKGGKLVLGYRAKSFMDQVEFTNYGFAKYNPAEVESILINAGFQDVATQLIKEPKLQFDTVDFEMEGIYTTGYKL